MQQGEGGRERDLSQREEGGSRRSRSMRSIRRGLQVGLALIVAYCPIRYFTIIHGGSFVRYPNRGYGKVGERRRKLNKVRHVFHLIHSSIYLLVCHDGDLKEES
ncbi:unnamed protein product [Tuber aestivum]|uniref:Uncharacterized protein n=1 Tax=Tuber aestivum TaxID=59557 RepID=A0A292PRR3_9PEZI|nr:unnamed protein product [Tuber aestivum]